MTINFVASVIFKQVRPLGRCNLGGRSFLYEIIADSGNIWRAEVVDGGVHVSVIEQAVVDVISAFGVTGAAIQEACWGNTR